MSEPIVVMVKRFRCPFCARGHSSRSRAVEHIARCWRNPAARGCKTCKHFDGHAEVETCGKGVDLSGRPQCERCGGYGDILAGLSAGMTECPKCVGDGSEIKAGPIVHCELWESRTPESAA